MNGSGQSTHTSGAGSAGDPAGRVGDGGRRVAVIGFGAIGQALARPWIDAGHRVVIGSRTPDDRAGQVIEFGAASCTDWATAVKGSDVVVLSVPFEALSDVRRTVPDWSGKIVVDVTNPIAISPLGRIMSGLDSSAAVGEQLAEQLGGARVVRAFTHVMDELLASRGRRQPGLWAMGIAADDPEAKAVVAALVQDTGFIPVDIGSLAESAPLDPGGELFPNMFTVGDMHARLASRTDPTRDGGRETPVSAARER